LNLLWDGLRKWASMPRLLITHHIANAVCTNYEAIDIANAVCTNHEAIDK
jgi:hypothetical protein